MKMGKGDMGLSKLKKPKSGAKIVEKGGRGISSVNTDGLGFISLR